MEVTWQPNRRFPCSIWRISRQPPNKTSEGSVRKSTGSADAERARLYISLENPLCECARMAEIAMDAQDAQADYATFAVDKLCDMVLSLREFYYGRPAKPIMERS